jgi:selT/selW/selH-like putative selenoprotein
LAAEVESHFSVVPELIESTGGKFEVVADDQLIFSKKNEGRFPETAEVLAAIGELAKDRR